MRLSKAEDEHESLVDNAELVHFELPGGATESLWVDDRLSVDEDAAVSQEPLLPSKRCWDGR